MQHRVLAHNLSISIKLVDFKVAKLVLRIDLQDQNGPVQ